MGGSAEGLTLRAVSIADATGDSVPEVHRPVQGAADHDAPGLGAGERGDASVRRRHLHRRGRHHRLHRGLHPGTLSSPLPLISTKLVVVNDCLRERLPSPAWRDDGQTSMLQFLPSP